MGNTPSDNTLPKQSPLTLPGRDSLPPPTPQRAVSVGASGIHSTVAEEVFLSPRRALNALPPTVCPSCRDRQRGSSTTMRMLGNIQTTVPLLVTSLFLRSSARVRTWITADPRCSLGRRLCRCPRVGRTAARWPSTAGLGSTQTRRCGRPAAPAALSRPGERRPIVQRHHFWVTMAPEREVAGEVSPRLR